MSYRRLLWFALLMAQERRGFGEACTLMAPLHVNNVIIMFMTLSLSLARVPDLVA